MFRPDSHEPARLPSVRSRGDALAMARERALALDRANDDAKRPGDVEIVFRRLDELQKQIEENQTNGDVDTALAAARDYTAVAANPDVENDRRFAPRVAEGWNQVGLLYRDEGDIDQAELALAKANEINRKTLGENHEATRQTCYYLASVYQNADVHRGSAGFAMKVHVTPPPPMPEPRIRPFSDKGKHPRDESQARLQDRMKRPEARKRVQESVLPVLTKALEDAQTAPERTRFAIALGNLGDLALDAEPVVLSRLKQAHDPNECYALVRALHRMSETPSEKAVEALAQTLNKCEADAVRRSVANYLGSTPTGRLELNEWAAKGKDAEKQIVKEALLRPRGGR
jgi:tetratricopeptide (TPR) repeat protein